MKANHIIVQDLRFYNDAAQRWGIVCPTCQYADTFAKRSEATDAKREHVCAINKQLEKARYSHK